MEKVAGKWNASWIKTEKNATFRTFRNFSPQMLNRSENLKKSKRSLTENSDPGILQFHAYFSQEYFCVPHGKSLE